MRSFPQTAAFSLLHFGQMLACPTPPLQCAIIESMPTPRLVRLLSTAAVLYAMATLCGTSPLLAQSAPGSNSGPPLTPGGVFVTPDTLKVQLPPVVLPKPNPRVAAYNRTWYLLYFVGTAWSMLGLLLLVRFRAGPMLRAALDSRFRSPLLRSALLYAGLTLLLLLWSLPVGYYGYLHERAYGFATHSPALWLLDRGRGYLIGLLQLPAVWAGYWLLERQPKRWWLTLWLLSIPWQVGMTVVWPVLVAPSFNQFRPLENTRLRDKLLAQADRAGIGDVRVLQMDSSRRNTKLNAYMSGIGPTKRIVLWDTTLKALSEEEILAIMAHEMGHYVLGHIWWGLAEGIVGAFVILWLLSRLLPWAIERWGKPTGVRSLHDTAGLPIAMLLLSIIMFLQTPIEAALSRIDEHAADRYAVELTGKNEALARTFVAFVERDFGDADPPPFLVFWFYSHPPLRERIEFVLNYQPPGR
jgi:STE24 endopeptidase